MILVVSRYTEKIVHILISNFWQLAGETAIDFGTQASIIDWAAAHGSHFHTHFCFYFHFASKLDFDECLHINPPFCGGGENVLFSKVLNEPKTVAHSFAVWGMPSFSSMLRLR